MVRAGSTLERYTKQTSNIENHTVESRENQINVGGPAYLCPATVDVEFASGAKKNTLRGTFSTSHFQYR